MKKQNWFAEIGIVFLVVALIAGAALIYPLTTTPDPSQPTQGSTAASQPSQSAPSDPTPQPTHPMQTDPTNPAESEPTKPTDPDPTKPTQTEPTKPADPEPTKPTETEPPKPTETQPDPTKPTSPDTENMVLTFVQWPETIKRGKDGTVIIQGKPNTEYTIRVYYKSGTSTAKGLEAKVSDADGMVTWTWKVSSRTTPGDFKIVVTGGGETVTVYYSVTE